MMTDAKILEQWFLEGRLVRPDPHQPSFVDLTRAMALLVGAKGVVSTNASESLAELIGAAEHIVFVLVDGMGDELLTRAPEKGFLRTHRVDRIQAVFPSTTAAALTSFATASWPRQHGSCGWWMYLRSRGISITTLPFVERFEEKSLLEHGLGIRDVFPLESVWSNMRHARLTVLQEEVKDSAFARYVTGGGARDGYRTIEQALHRVAQRVEGATGPTFTYVYLPQLDARCHEAGIDDAVPVLEKLDKHLGWLARDLGDRARLVISADHGMIDLPLQRVAFIDEHPDLLDALEVPPSGEPTMPVFHVRSGCEGRFWDRFHEVLGGLFALITPDDVERLGLMGSGELSDVVRSRLGSFLGIASEPSALYYRQGGREPFLHRSVHCGLSPAEMWIPLILAGLETPPCRFSSLP